MLWSRLQTANRLDPHIPLYAEIGELVEYDPKTGTGQFDLPMREDPNDQSQASGFIPCGTMLAGPGFGMQFPPDRGMQALILFSENHSPVAAVFLPNLVDVPPWADGKSSGWKDKTGNEIKTTVDGAGVGDGAGGARVVGKGYASVVSPKVELGAEGLDATFYVIRHKDLEAMKTDIYNKIIQTFNTHTHTGNGVPPTQQMTNLNTTQASASVKAND